MKQALFFLLLLNTLPCIARKGYNIGDTAILQRPAVGNKYRHIYWGSEKMSRKNVADSSIAHEQWILIGITALPSSRDVQKKKLEFFNGRQSICALAPDVFMLKELLFKNKFEVLDKFDLSSVPIVNKDIRYEFTTRQDGETDKKAKLFFTSSEFEEADTALQAKDEISSTIIKRGCWRFSVAEFGLSYSMKCYFTCSITTEKGAYKIELYDFRLKNKYGLTIGNKWRDDFPIAYIIRRSKEGSLLETTILQCIHNLATGEMIKAKMTLDSL